MVSPSLGKKTFSGFETRIARPLARSIHSPFGTLSLRSERDDLADAEREAADAGDERIQTHACLIQLLAEMYLEPEGKTDAAYTEGTQAIQILPRHGDEQRLARAWLLVAEQHALTGRTADLEEAARHVEAHARGEDGTSVRGELRTGSARSRSAHGRSGRGSHCSRRRSGKQPCSDASRSPSKSSRCCVR